MVRVSDSRCRGSVRHIFLYAELLDWWTPNQAFLQRSCSSLYRLPRFINCPTYITLHYIIISAYPPPSCSLITHIVPHSSLISVIRYWPKEWGRWCGLGEKYSRPTAGVMTVCLQTQITSGSNACVEYWFAFAFYWLWVNNGRTDMVHLKFCVSL